MSHLARFKKFFLLIVIFFLAFYAKQFVIEKHYKSHELVVYDGIITENVSSSKIDIENSNQEMKNTSGLFSKIKIPDSLNMQKYFIELEYVCIKENSLIFFNIDQSLFQKWLKTRKPYTNWIRDKYPIYKLKDINFKTSFSDWTRQNKAKIFSGTTSLAAPHHPDNNFHYHNDLVFPVLFDILKTNSKHDYKRLLLFRGWEARMENHCVLYHILLKLFNSVIYPFEDFLEKNSPICFDKFIWGQGRSPLPYYAHYGRFGSENEFEYVSSEMRDWVYDAFGLGTNYSDGCKLKKPVLTWLRRPNGDRQVMNYKDFLSQLREYFEVQIIDNFGNHVSVEEGEKKSLETLKILKRTNILIGIHGAGLGHTFYLPPKSIIIEMKVGFGYEKNLFMNMANLLDIGYYRADVRKYYTKNGVLLDEWAINTLTRDIYEVYQKECTHVDRTVNPCRIEVNKNSSKLLSDIRFSKCYLQIYGGQWKQCTHTDACR